MTVFAVTVMLWLSAVALDVDVDGTSVFVSIGYLISKKNIS